MIRVDAHDHEINTLLGLAARGLKHGRKIVALIDDGDVDEHAKPENVRRKASDGTNTGTDADGLVKGAKVEAKFGGKGKFYPGTIQKVNADGTFAILFDDGDKEPKALREHVKLVGAPSTDYARLSCG